MTGKPELPGVPGTLSALWHEWLSRRFASRMAAAGLLLAGLAAAWASPGDGSGQVMAWVGDSAGFVPLRDGRRLQAHDRVLLPPGASAKVRFGDGCERLLQGPLLFVAQDCTLPAMAPAGSVAPFDGAAFLARTGGLGPVRAEATIDTLGP